MSDNKLHTKYRPAKFDDVVGQSAVVASLRKIIKRRSAQSFILTGPSGTGKTTLARICAKELGCAPAPPDTREIDAATKTGIDDMREIKETLLYRPFGQSIGRAIIIDEAHRLSSNAWDSLLKDIEEPSANVYWFLCTTNAAKIPATIKTRCASFVLRPVADKDLGDLFDDICGREKIDVPGDVRDLIIREANGSPRQLLVNLDVCRDAETKKAAAALLQTALQSDATLELCRFVLNGGSWIKAMALMEKLKDENPEGIRILMCNYIAAALKNATSDQKALFLLQKLECFATPYNTSERIAPLYMSIGQSLFGGE